MKNLSIVITTALLSPWVLGNGASLAVDSPRYFTRIQFMFSLCHCSSPSCSSYFSILSQVISLVILPSLCQSLHCLYFDSSWPNILYLPTFSLDLDLLHHTAVKSFQSPVSAFHTDSGVFQHLYQLSCRFLWDSVTC